MRKNVFYWALYDFANSLLFIVFIFYFPQWLVTDQGNPAWWFNATLIASSILFILVAPFASFRIDTGKKKIQGLRLWTALFELSARPDSYPRRLLGYTGKQASQQ